MSEGCGFTTVSAFSHWITSFLAIIPKNFECCFLFLSVGHGLAVIGSDFQAHFRGVWQQFQQSLYNSVLSVLRGIIRSIPVEPPPTIVDVLLGLFQSVILISLVKVFLLARRQIKSVGDATTTNCLIIRSSSPPPVSTDSILRISVGFHGCAVPMWLTFNPTTSASPTVVSRT